MMKIELTPCMVFDAMCFLNYDIDYDIEMSAYWRPEQKAFREKIEKLTSAKLYNGYIGMSTVIYMIASYDRNGKFENYTLDDLAKLFNNFEYIKEILLNKLAWASNVEYSPKDWIKIYLNYISILKEIGFDKLWESDLLPIIQESINKRQEMFKNYDLENILADIQKLKQCKPLEDIKIFISVMNCPVAMKLPGNSFLDHVGNNYSTQYMANFYHELMHGFINDELESLYLEYINGIDYLKKQYYTLINNRMRSGNEEEFVLAAEYYLRMKHSSEERIELLKKARKHCDGCMPTSVFLFDLLSKEAEIPNGYSKWLVDVFKNKKLPQGAIEYNLDRIYQ